jgi:two-component system, LuxR family, response regulator FixJ
MEQSSSLLYPQQRTQLTDDIHIALIDDHPAILDSLRLYLERNGVRTSCFSAAEDFLPTINAKRLFDCVVADVRMPGLSGIDLVRETTSLGNTIPIILITAFGEVEMAVAAIKLGAFDFLEKPFDEKRLLKSIQDAIGRAPEGQEDYADLKELRSRAGSLTDRQREVMDLAATGLSNKEIALRLQISHRTVESHRAWVMERMQARNLAELVRKVIRLNPGRS